MSIVETLIGTGTSTGIMSEALFPRTESSFLNGGTPVEVQGIIDNMPDKPTKMDSHKCASTIRGMTWTGS